MPKGGVPDAVTIELRLDNSGILTGKFLNPVQAEFSKATFSPKTGLIAVEATDQKSVKHYNLEGKIKDTELQGILSAGDVSGELRLIKWTFFGRWLRIHLEKMDVKLGSTADGLIRCRSTPMALHL